MKKLFICSATIVILYGVVSCKQEFHYLTPRQDSATDNVVKPCQAPPIEKNIIGTWHFESTLSLVTQGGPKSGTITFEQGGVIIDPDSLFENRLDMGPVTSKTYKAAVPNQLVSGTYFEVYLKTKKGGQTTYYSLVSSDCKRIHLRLFQSENNGIGFILTR